MTATQREKKTQQPKKPSKPSKQQRAISLSLFLFNRPFFSLLWFALSRSRSRSRSLCPWVFYRALLTQSHPPTDSFSSSRSPNCKSFFPLISNPNFSILLLLSKIPNYLFIYLFIKPQSALIFIFYLLQKLKKIIVFENRAYRFAFWFGCCMSTIRVVRSSILIFFI